MRAMMRTMTGVKMRQGCQQSHWASSAAYFKVRDALIPPQWQESLNTPLHNPPSLSMPIFP